MIEIVENIIVHFIFFDFIYKQTVVAGAVTCFEKKKKDEKKN